MIQPSFSLWFFPSVATKADARKAAYQGFWAAIVVASITVVFAAIAVTVGPVDGVPIDGWAFFDAGLFVAIAIFIRKLSRAGAVCGLGLYCLERIGMWAMYGVGPNDISSIWMIALLVIAFINGIRGTFAYHRMTTVD